ncbi:RNA polymerase sigma factor SigW [Marinicrinis sediminis]|uniref:RNA polymerase sigma factor n=1 Tax=Marinicrinis sediminis TaxID=1652465 RepID=A0ABW5REN3_9BACL
MHTIETRLAKLARDGDRHAFAEIVDLYKDKIYHLSYRMLGNAQEAEDVVQETFIRVYKNIKRYDPTHKFSTWIYRIGTNLCIDRLRKRKFTAYSLDADQSDGEGMDGYSVLAAKDPLPEDQLTLSETQQQIREAISKMPEKYRSVIILRYLEDMSLQEISEVLDMPVTTIKTRVHRGREYLRKRLDHAKLI